MAIRLERLRDADLNLLTYLAVLVEEKSMARASLRLRLTQSALSKALQRLRETFQDELLLKVGDDWQPTLRGEILIRDLAVLLPQLEQLLMGRRFDPGVSEVAYRLTMADSVSHIYGPLLGELQQQLPGISFQIRGFDERRYSDLTSSRTDLLIEAEFKQFPPDTRRETLFEEEFVCVVPIASPHRNRIGLEEYLQSDHITVDVLEQSQVIPDLKLGQLGRVRRNVIVVPYFSVAARMVSAPRLITTTTRTLAKLFADKRKTRIVKAPAELGSFRYAMFWHPRDEANEQHRWLRETFRNLTKKLYA